MKNLLSFSLVLIIAFTLTACGNNTTTDSEEGTQTTTVSDLDITNQKILVAYFSISGNTEIIANQIQESVGGDIFKIETAAPYPADYDDLTDQAQQEQNDNFRPELANQVDNMDSYDVIFLGYPNWWGTIPMALFTFLEENDLSGKKIVPFTTHDGSGFGRSISDIEKLSPEATIVEGFSVRGKSADSSQEDVSEWLAGLEINN
ncbi:MULTISPECIES: flavodoxin [Paenibacillus]|uniref:flavodoxin n=1 Tax=Paenibacillus TaxID=44249 RepID=UPI001C64FE61|nr:MULTISPECIES: flavodoxin [Paenibacillus]QYK65469.1 Flavodoxin [Paenibacillus sp. S02]